MAVFTGYTAKILTPHHFVGAECAGKIALQVIQQVGDLVEVVHSHQRGIAAGGLGKQFDYSAGNDTERSLAADKQLF